MGEEQTSADEDADDKKREEQQKPPEMETLVAEENSLATVAESIVRETDAKTALSAAEETTVAVERRNDSAEVSLQHRKAAMGPSIYDVHTEGGRLRWTHVDGGGGPAPCGRHTEN